MNDKLQYDDATIQQLSDLFSAAADPNFFVVSFTKPSFAMA